MRKFYKKICVRVAAQFRFYFLKYNSLSVLLRSCCSSTLIFQMMVQFCSKQPVSYLLIADGSCAYFSHT